MFIDAKREKMWNRELGRGVLDFLSGYLREHQMFPDWCPAGYSQYRGESEDIDGELSYVRVALQVR